MTDIQAIQSVIDQGRKAFAEGKSATHNPHVNNPEFAMHWKFGFDEASKAEPIGQVQQPETEQAPTETEQAPTETEQAPTETEQAPTETEQPKDEAKASKKSKE
jgi:hypothetical protein